MILFLVMVVIKMMMMMMVVLIMKSVVLGCDASTFDQIKHGRRCNDP